MTKDELQKRYDKIFDYDYKEAKANTERVMIKQLTKDYLTPQIRDAVREMVKDLCKDLENTFRREVDPEEFEFEIKQQNILSSINERYLSDTSETEENADDSERRPF